MIKINLLNLQIFNFLMVFVLIVVKATNYEEECHILNLLLLLLFQLKIVSYIEIIKKIII